MNNHYLGFGLGELRRVDYANVQAVLDYYDNQDYVIRIQIDIKDYLHFNHSSIYIDLQLAKIGPQYTWNKIIRS